MARHYLTLSEKAETEGESKTAEESRKALALLCKSQASGAVSRVGASTQKQNLQGLGNKPRAEKSNRGFDIFSDQTQNDALAENPGWKSLPKQKESRKENDGMCYFFDSKYMQLLNIYVLFFHSVKVTNAQSDLIYQYLTHHIP